MPRNLRNPSLAHRARPILKWRSRNDDFFGTYPFNYLTAMKSRGYSESGQVAEKRAVKARFLRHISIVLVLFFDEGVDDQHIIRRVPGVWVRRWSTYQGATPLL